MDPVEAVRRRGVVLQSARGPEPSLAELVVGEPIRGSWWGHPESRTIFEVINTARASRAIVATRLYRGRVTLVHRRLWPALCRLADRVDEGALDAVTEEHTPSGAHRAGVVPFPDWVPPAVLDSARRMSEDEAVGRLPVWVRGVFGEPDAG